MVPAGVPQGLECRGWRADVSALARPHLVDPHLVLGASAAYEYFDQPWPKRQ